MTSSAELARAKVDSELPPALRSMWRLCKLGYRHEPRLMLAAFALSQLAALPDALLALWIKLLGDGLLDRDAARVRAAALAIGVSAAATWFLSVVSVRVQRRFRDRVTIALESHVARLQASVATIAHHERPDYLDRLAVLRDQIFVLDHMYMSVFSTAGWVLRLGVTVALLVSIHPALVLLAAFALPTVLSSTWRPAVERRAQEAAAPANRLARHLFTTATTAPPGKEVRVTGIGRRLARRAARGVGARLRAGGRGALGQRVVAHAGVGGLRRRLRRRGGVGVARAARAGGRRAAAARRGGAPVALRRRARWARSASCAASGWTARAASPGSRTTRRRWWRTRTSRCRRGSSRGIRFDHVSFAYPGTERLVLDDVSLTLPAGAVVAVVGENGAGKTTLVKLLRQALRADGRRDLRRRRSRWRGCRRRRGGRGWRERSRTSSASSCAPATPSASATCRGCDEERGGRRRGRRARAPTTSCSGCPRVSTPSSARRGPAASRSRSASGRSWRWRAASCATTPLLLVLDEPTAALDAETEHALFERYAAGARGAGDDGRITILVSHRFSTVRMADLIVVLDGARVVEVGSHDELVAKGGQYAELYGIQAAAYR